MNIISRLAVSACAAVALTACAGHQNVKGSGTETPPPAASSVPEQTAPAPEQQSQGAETAPVASNPGFQGNPLDDPNSPLHQRVVYFDFDKSEIKSEGKPILEAHAKYLSGHPDVHVVLEGNTDERGTREYNMALGERRAKAVYQFMTLLGVSPSQLKVISYGEERPAVLGHDESAWSKNRRVELDYGG